MCCCEHERLSYFSVGVSNVVLQIAGAAAAEGLSLKEVTAVATKIAKQCRSVGVATRICTLPGAAPSDRSTVQVPLHPLPLFCSGFVLLDRLFTRFFGGCEHFSFPR